MEHTIDTSPVTVTSPLTITEEDIEKFLTFKSSDGVKPTVIGKYRGYLRSLHKWLPEDKIITKERLLEWRASLEASGYGKVTVEKYVTYVNLYTKHHGHPEFNIKKSNALDLRGMRFGYLTAIEPTEKRYRKDVIWRCRCKCGKEIELPSTSLTMKNTASCGCLTADIFDYHNRYVDGTALRQSLEEKVINPNSASGYVGVQPNRGKWRAYITYKRKTYSIGYYSKLEDAVKARARAKEEIMADATRLYEATDHLYLVKPEKPRKTTKKPAEPKLQTAPTYQAQRNDNTTGHTGIKHAGVNWKAEISYNGIRYHLGLYKTFEEAVAARKQAEALVLVKDISSIEEMSVSSTTYRIKTAK